MPKYIRNQDGDIELPLDVMSLRVARGNYDEAMVCMKCGNVDVVLGEYDRVSDAAEQVVNALLQADGVYHMSGHSNSHDVFGW